MGKITLLAAQSLPLDRLAASSGNVRRIKAGVSIPELAEDIGRRGLLQSLSVRPVLDEAGTETGRYAVVAGGRRFAALQLLVRGKRLNKTAPVPCIVQRADIAAEEDSLAENMMREALHRSTSSAPSRPCATGTASARRKSRPASSSPRRWCASA